MIRQLGKFVADHIDLIVVRSATTQLNNAAAQDFRVLDCTLWIAGKTVSEGSSNIDPKLPTIDRFANLETSQVSYLSSSLLSQLQIRQSNQCQSGSRYC